MPLRLDVKRKLLARSDRVKSVDLHPAEPWMMSSLYNGKVHVWNYENQQMVKSFEVCDLPVRTAKFVPRKNWIITGSDDMQIRVFNYNTLDRVHQFEAHSDYVRCIAIHPTLPYILTASDDMTIKLWDWDNKWQCKQTFEGHNHYVMQVVINPKDNNTFATASLDRTVKVWQLGSNQPNFTLEGHEKGVNCVDYYHGGDKPYLISGADDRLAKIWDYQNKTCVATLDGHNQNISAVCFHPELPIILTGSEDSTVRIWHANTYRLETTLNYGLERAWVITALKGSNTVAVGYDEGSIIIKVGREEPAVSMDGSGKILYAKHSEIQQANLKTLGAGDTAEIKDGERLPLSVYEVGACEIYPQTIQHSPNGRFAVVCGDGEYIIYTAMKLRNKSFGSALEFVWAQDSNLFAIRESNGTIKAFKSFKEYKNIKPDFSVEGIYGGSMLGVKSANHLCFYEWDSLKLIRRIEINAKQAIWSENSELVAITTEESFYILKYNAQLVATTPDTSPNYSEDGLEDAFEVLGEVADTVKTGLWVGDCFVYTTAHSRLNYYVGGEIVTVAHLDRPMYLLGYIAKDSRLYLSDKDVSVVSYQLQLSVLEYQTAVMRRDFDMADKMLATVPKDQRTRVAHFLEKQGFKKQALAVSQDPEHRFDLALSLGDLKVAHELALEADSEEKWRQLSHAATMKSELILAGECLGRAKDYGGLLLLASSAGSMPLMNKLSHESLQNGQNNVAFVSNFLLGKLDECLELLVKTDRLPEAALFARTYAPSQISRIVTMWKDKVALNNQKMADCLADPTKYENLFPGLKESFKAEQYLHHLSQQPIPAAIYARVPPNSERNVLEELTKAEEKGVFCFDANGKMIAPPPSSSSTAPKRFDVPRSPPPTTLFGNVAGVIVGGASRKEPPVTSAAAAVSGVVVEQQQSATTQAKKCRRSPSPPHYRRQPSPPPEEPQPQHDEDDDDDDDHSFTGDSFADPGFRSEAPDIAKSSQMRPDLVLNNQQAPEIVRDSKKINLADEDDNLDLDLDNLDLNDVDIEGDIQLDDELNLTDD